MFRSILPYLGIYTLFIAFFSLLNILFCFYFDSLLNINVYVVSLAFSLLLSAIFIYFNKKILSEKITFFKKILLVIIGFFYFPLLISIPYFLSIYNLSFIDSYFEAISGFTSTGFSIFENTKNIDEPLLIWRSSSQWLGGLYFIYSLFLLSESSKTKIKNLYSNYESSNLIEIQSQYTKVLVIYLLSTAFIFIFLTFANIRLFEGFNLSLTIISSGGFLPTNSLTEIIRNNNQKFITAFCMLIPYFNLYLIFNIFFDKKSFKNNSEDLYLLIFLIFILSIVYIFFNNSYGFSTIFFTIVSSLSNIGLGLDIPFFNLSVLFLVLVMVGGSSFSSSSGIKLIRLYTLFKFSLKEIYLIVKPLHVSTNVLFLSKHKIKDEAINNYFLIIVFFFISTFILSGILSFENITFKDILTLSILTITNTVNSSNYNLTDFSFLNLSVISKISLILFMIIGKVELLSFLILIKKFFFK